MSFWDSTNDICVQTKHGVMEHKEIYLLIKMNNKFHQQVLNIFQVESIIGGKG